MIRPVFIFALPVLLVLGPITTPAAEPLQPPYSWRGIDGTGVFPAGDTVTAFHDLAADMVITATDRGGRTRSLDLPGPPGTRSNIVWRTTLPYWGHSTPLVVGDRVFVITDQGWKDDAVQLVCVDAAEGAILWKKPIDHLDAWPPAKAAAARALRAKNHEYWRLYMTSWNRLVYDDAKNGFATHPKDRFMQMREEVLAQTGLNLFSKPGKCVFTKDGKEFFRAKSGFGAWRSRCYWKHGNDEMKKVGKEVKKQRLHLRMWWASEGPYYESTFASPVSDGEVVYALSHPDAVAAYALDGTRRWSADLELGGRVGFYGGTHTDMASPVLVGDVLLCHSAGHALMTGLDRRTGRRLWRTPYPRSEKTHRDWGGKGVPRGSQGHMGPGGTPVVMQVPVASAKGADVRATVVVANNGVVLRPTDGAYLGQVHLPPGTPIRGKKKTVPSTEATYGSSYQSWVAHDDVLYYAPHEGLYAVRLGLADGKLTQEVLWRCQGQVDNRDPNLVVHGGRLYAKVRVGRRRGIGAVDPATGKVVAWGPRCGGGYVTNLGFGRDRAVWKTGWIGDRTESKSNPATTPGHGMTQWVVVSLPDLKPIGKGFLCPETPTGEVAERNIAGIGTARVVGSNAGVGVWGNRIFIRDHAYLWCIGDPKEKWVPPERYLKRGGRRGGRP